MQKSFSILIFSHNCQIQIQNLYNYFFIKVNICFWLYIYRIHFNSSICIVVFFNYVIQSINTHIFSILMPYINTLMYISRFYFFGVLINLLPTTDFPSIMSWIILSFLLTKTSVICYKICYLYQPVFSLACIQIHLKFSENR